MHHIILLSHRLALTHSAEGMAKRAAATGSREEPASGKVLVDETLLTVGELQEVLHNAYTEGEEMAEDAPMLPPNATFTELLLGNWEGFDMASPLFNNDGVISIDTLVSPPSRFGSGGRVGALDIASAMQAAGYEPQ